VPIASAEESAARAFRAFLISLIGVFLALLVVVNAALYVVIVRPVRRIAHVAERVSMADATAPEFPSGGPEMSALVHAFNRMRISLDKALKLLES
jgi:protein-histidine pros-kinase